MSVILKPNLSYPNSFVMDIPEKDTLMTSMRDFMANKADKNKEEVYKAAFDAYLDWLIAYVNTELRGKSYIPDEIANFVFATELPTKKQAVEKYFTYSLFVLAQYVTHIKSRISATQYISRYETLMYNLLSDAEYVLAGYNQKRLHDDQWISTSIGSRTSILPIEILRASNQLFNLEESPSIDTLDFRNLKPYMVFNIRQLLERLGENLIGYDTITDQQGRPIHKFTQVAWDFLKERSGKGAWILTMPYQVNTIYSINRWTNAFVHPANIMMSHLQFYSLHIMNNLMKMRATPVRTYEGRNHQNVNFGDIRIEHYNALKQDFEAYIAGRMKQKRFCWRRFINFITCKKPNPNFTINWKPLDDVGAYIISL